MSRKTVAVFPGDDASPEVMHPTVELLEKLHLPIDFVYPMVGNEALAAHGSRFPETSKAQVDEADATFFGSTSGQSTEALVLSSLGQANLCQCSPLPISPGLSIPHGKPRKY